MKHIWKPDDKTLIEKRNHGFKFTETGWTTYWSAFDSTVKYFDKKVIPQKIAETEHDYADFASRRSYVVDHRINHNPDRKTDYNKTHWHRDQKGDRSTSNDWNKYRREPLTKKIFGRQHHADSDRRILPTPPQYRKK